MDSKQSSSNFHILKASIARLVFFRLLFFASAIAIVSLICFLPSFDFASLSPKTYEDCVTYSQQSRLQNASLTPGSYLFQSRIINNFWGSFDSTNNCQRIANLTFSVVNELMGRRFLNRGSRSLCIGEGSPMAVSAMQTLGFTSVSGVHKSSFFSLKHKRIVYDLEYQESSFDFVFSKDVDKVSVPALLVLEVERILKPGGIGALLVDPTDPSSNPSDLVKSATPFSSLLRSSSIVHVGHVNELTLVVFKKRYENNRRSFPFFNQHRHLQGECASLIFTKPLIELMEPLVEERPPPQEHEKRISYLPNFVDLSNRKRLVHIDIGVRENKKENVTNDWFLPSHYPIDHKDFSVYFVHYNTSILSHVKRPGITFVYHPGLSEKAAAKVGGDGGEEEFDFTAWFKETVEHADFVVLKMHAGKVEMKFLKDMFESGGICFVNELFLSCSDSKEIRCMDIYKDLRDSGVYVHQWWETELHQASEVVDVP